MTVHHPSPAEIAASSLEGRLTAIRQRIDAACARARRGPETVRLVAVSKTVPADGLAAAAAHGQLDFGESYIQEALPKIGLTESLAGWPLNWHFIGPIQGNKTRTIAAVFSWAHGIERLKIAERLSAQRRDDQPSLQVLVQVNVSGESSKSGCTPQEAAALCAAASRLPRLQLRGLMCIPEAAVYAVDARPAFAALRALQIAIRDAGQVDRQQFDQLSMGMSDDFETAIEEGATIIRVGSAIFGARSPPPSTGDSA